MRYGSSLLRFLVPASGFLVLASGFLVPASGLLFSTALAANPAENPSDGAPASVPAEASAPRFSAEARLRAEYLRGQPILVPIQLWNEGKGVVTVPDIEKRPWLVEFRLDAGNGEVERRRNTPPETDSGASLQLQSRGQRRTLLEVPLSSRLSQDSYRLTVALDDGGQERSLGVQDFRVVDARPVEGDLQLGVSAASRAEPVTIWLHGATEGFDLYVQQRAGGPSLFLAHLATKVRPQLTEAPGSAAHARQVVWMEGDRKVGWLRLEVAGLDAAPSYVELPWPKAALVAHPSVDGAGQLHVPLWIPAPKGAGGELRVLTLRERGGVSYRRAGVFSAPPVAVDTTVDDAGLMHLLVATASTIDLFAVRGVDAATAELPLPGRRIWTADPGNTTLDARFGVRASMPEIPGGLSVLASSVSGEGQLVSQWVSLQGTRLHSASPVVIPEGARLVGVLPSQSEAVGYLFKTGERTALFVQGGQRATLDTTLHGDWALGRDAKDAPLMRRLVPAGPIVSEAIVLPAP